MKPIVVFLHGLGRTHRSLSGLKRHVEEAGYETWARTYSSRGLTVAELGKEVAGWIREDLPKGREIVGVTHSLGGIVARHMRDLLPWKGLVMLAPPNTGSRVAAYLTASPLFRWCFGPSGPQLGAPAGWPMPPSPFAVIAGTKGASVSNPNSWLVSALDILPPDGPHDGTVAVDEAKLPDMAAFATVHASHTWIMNDPLTQRLVLEFLEHGRFESAPTEGD